MQHGGCERALVIVNGLSRAEQRVKHSIEFVKLRLRYMCVDDEWNRCHRPC